VKKLIVATVAIVGAVITAVVIAGVYRFNFTDGGDLFPTEVPTGVKNLAVTIDGQTFALTNGVAEIPGAPGSAATNTARLVGEPVMGDADGDGSQDAALLVEQDPGGSGTFYYAVVAIDDAGSYRASNALSLGDRIEPHTVEFTDGRFVYSYAERKPGESMADRSSVERRVWIAVDKTTGVISAS
jgi:hypothetical protein